MSAPTLTAFLDAAPCPRVEVFFPSFDAGTASVTVYRLAGGQERQVRGAVGAPTGGTLTRVDFEVPFNVPVTYRAEQFDAAGVSLGFTPSSTLAGQYTAWVEQRRNLNPNPVAGGTTGYAVGSGTGGVSALSNPSSVPLPTFMGGGVGAVARGTWSTAPSAGGTLSGPRMSVTAGQTVAVSLGVEGSSAATYTVSMDWYTAGNVYISTVVVGSAALAASTWERFSWVGVVPVNAAQVAPYVGRPAGLPSGNTIDMVGGLYEVAGSVGDFFWPAVVSDVQQSRFLGADNNSSSVLESRSFLGTGVPSADTWMHNPLDPQGSAVVFFGDDNQWSVTRPTPGVVSHPKGRRVGVVLSEPRQGVAGLQLTVRTSNDSDADKVQAMCGDNSLPPVLCVRLGTQDGRLRVPQPLFLSALSVAEVDMNTRWGGTELAHMVDGDEVDPPIPGLFVPLLTREDLNVSFATRTALNAAGLTRSDINRLYQYAGAAG